MKVGYRVHRFDINMAKDLTDFERFLNGLEGEVVAIIPNVTMTRVDFVLVVEKISRT